MTPFTLGQRVEWEHETAKRTFRGNLVGWVADKYYALTLMDGEERPKLVRRERLKHAGSWMPKEQQTA